MISALITSITRSHSQLNPLVLDLSDLVKEADQTGAATVIQSSWRGKIARSKTAVTAAVVGNSQLTKQMASMSVEIRELKEVVLELKKELAASKGK